VEVEAAVLANPGALRFGIEQSMTTPHSERRRFQFGLRKLLLWTAVVALLLGVAATFGEEAWISAGWIIVVGIVRVAFGPKVGGVLSVAAGMILVAAFLCLVFVASEPGPRIGEAVAVGVIFGGLFGLAMFSITEYLYLAVNWADNLMQTRTDD